MTPIPTFEIEFPCSGPAFEHVMSAVRELTDGIDEAGIRVEPLVRAHGHLLEPWHAEAGAADGYALRIHLDPFLWPGMERVRQELHAPLSAYGVAVRETTQVH